jgi:hypothetical protein
MIRFHLLAPVFKPGLFLLSSLNDFQFPPNLDTIMKLLVRKVNLVKIYIVIQYYQAF